MCRTNNSDMKKTKVNKRWKRILDICKREGLTQMKFADKIGISHQRLHYTKRTGNINIDVWEKINKLFGEEGK